MARSFRPGFLVGLHSDLFLHLAQAVPTLIGARLLMFSGGRFGPRRLSRSRHDKYITKLFPRRNDISEILIHHLEQARCASRKIHIVILVF
jgi:hypothetical protein